MNVHEALLNRVTVHNYEQTDIDDEVVERAIEAAVAAPNHKMTEPWRFVRVGRGTRTKLLPIAIELKARKSGREPNDALTAAVTKKIINPAELIVVCQVRTDDAFTSKEDYAAISCAIENMLLSFHADGIGSKWGTGGVTRDPRTYEILGVDPEDEAIVGFVWAGTPAGNTKKLRRRMAARDVTRTLP